VPIRARCCWFWCCSSGGLPALRRTGLSSEPARFFDTAAPPVVFVSPGGEMRVDVLTSASGRSPQGPQPIAALHVHAEPWRFVDHPIAEPSQVAAPLGTGAVLLLPLPARFADHELLLVARRPRAGTRQGPEAGAAPAGDPGGGAAGRGAVGLASDGASRPAAAARRRGPTGRP